MNVQVCTILVGCHDRALDVPSWLKSIPRPCGFQPTNFSPMKKNEAGGACLVCLVPTYLAKLALLASISLEQAGPPGPGDLDFRFPLLQNCRCNPRVFQSAKSFGLLFSSSAARAPSPSSISWKKRMQNNDLGLVF